MKKSEMQGKVVAKEKKAQYGYWMYADGSSYWGLRIYRGMELPVEITKNRHQEKDASKKLKWTHIMEEEAEAKEVKEAQEKAKAKKAKEKSS